MSIPELSTQISIPKSPIKIDYNTSLFFIGSCFADSIGKRMCDLKFKACLNPFGVVYNPIALAANLKLLIEKEQYTPDDLSFYDELWFSFSHYTLYADTDQSRCLEKINNSFRHAREFITRSGFLIITLGTSWVYELKENARVVANCHKLPSSHFNRFFSSVENSTTHLKASIRSILEINPYLQVILTISPVRHWKDGAIDNQRSKAALILTAANLQRELQNVLYFPAYEIFMDELRDYRYYAADMLHPSDVAVEYTWQKFSDWIVSKETIPLIKSVEEINSSLKHKTRNPNLLASQKFRDNLINKIKDLSAIYPFLDFQDEIELLNKTV